MSCGAKYSVPDGRVGQAGTDGLRVRCTRCRAIMVVSESQRFLHESTDGDGNSSSLPRPATAPVFSGVASGPVTASGAKRVPKSLEEDTRPNRKRHPAAEAAAATLSEIGGVAEGSMANQAPVEAPAALSASGVFRPIAGVNRNITGFFFPELEVLKEKGQSTSARIWYVALSGRPRGPFSASEMMILAERGKVRENTMVWRPGFSAWCKVKHGDVASAEDLSWLLGVVSKRREREREIAAEAERKLGIQPVQLSRTSSGQVRQASMHTVDGPGLPPPLPSFDTDDDEVALMPGSYAGAAGLASGIHALEDGKFEWKATDGQTPSKGLLQGSGAMRWLLPLAVALASGALVGLAFSAFGTPLMAWLRALVR